MLVALRWPRRFIVLGVFALSEKDGQRCWGYGGWQATACSLAGFISISAGNHPGISVQARFVLLNCTECFVAGAPPGLR